MLTKNQPQYAVVADTLIAAVADGTYPVGSLLPPEIDLADQFGVSRNTMRSAIRVLVDMGMVSRRAGMGTLVQSQAIAPNFVQAIESLEQLLPNLGSTELALLNTQDVVADDLLAMLLACSRGESWVRFNTVRRTRQKPTSLSYISLYVQPAFRSLGKQLNKLREPAFTALESTLDRRIADVVQQSDAAAMPADVAAELGVEVGSPALRTVRRFVGEDGRILMVSDSYTPPGTEGFTIRFRASWAGKSEE